MHNNHEFHLGDGWFGNIEWSVKDCYYIGTMYVTSEYSLGVLWSSELDGYFESSEDMIEYAADFIRRNNT